MLETKIDNIIEHAEKISSILKLDELTDDFITAESDLLTAFDEEDIETYLTRVVVYSNFSQESLDSVFSDYIEELWSEVFPITSDKNSVSMSPKDAVDFIMSINHELVFALERLGYITNISCFFDLLLYCDDAALTEKYRLKFDDYFRNNYEDDYLYVEAHHGAISHQCIQLITSCYLKHEPLRLLNLLSGDCPFGEIECDDIILDHREETVVELVNNHYDSLLIVLKKHKEVGNTAISSINQILTAGKSGLDALCSIDGNKRMFVMRSLA